MPDVSAASIERATGRAQDAWFDELDALDADDHTARTKALSAAHPDVSGWWIQAVVVEYERARGLREVGQSCAGDYQVSCSKTVALDADAAFERIVTADWLPGARWEEGATFTTHGGDVEVRVVTPGKQVRFWWHDDDGRATIVADVWPNKAGDKHSIRITAMGLPSQEARARHREHWKAALDVLAG